MKGVEMNKVRTMTIIMDAEDENNITILSNNLGGPVTFCQNEVEFLRKVLKNVEAKSSKLSSDSHNSRKSFF